MAYRIKHQDVIDGRLSLIRSDLVCYDRIDDDECYFDRDELLYNRSALELVREQLSDDQRTELDQVDAYWKSNAKAFNRAFAVEHHQVRRKTALEGWAWGDDGGIPEIPADHWWWRPLNVQ